MKFCILLIGLAGSIVLAEESSPDRAPLSSVIVTATRTELSDDEVLAPTLVISREEIDLSMANDIANLLRFHAGLDIARVGGPGQQTSVFIRGTDSNQAMVLVDGVKINPATAGGAAIQNITPNMVERIEIVKGPRSSLYGSDAIGGVINVITRSPQSGSAIDLSAGAGRFNTKSADFAGGWRKARGGVGVNLSWFDTDGFPTRTDDDLDRGYDNFTANLRADGQLGPIDGALRYWQASGTTEYSGFNLDPLSQDYLNSAAAFSMSGQPGERWSTDVELSYIVDDIQQNQNPDFVETKRGALDWQNDLLLGRQQIVTGLYLSSVDTRSLSFGTGLEESIDINAVYVEDMLSFSRQNVLLAARYTDHETFGDEVTWNVEYGYDIAAATRLIASAGTGFRAPDSTELFGFGGNPDLLPEISENAELAIRHRVNTQQSLAFGIFRTDIENLIEFVITDPATFAGQNENVGRARIEGLEARYRFIGDLWDVRAEAILQDPKNMLTGETLLRRAKESLTVGMMRRLGRHRLGLDVLATGERKGFGFPEPVTLDPYVLVNLAGQFTINDRWSVQALIDNLLNEQYELANGFNTADRGLYVQFNYQNR